MNKVQIGKDYEHMKNILLGILMQDKSSGNFKERGKSGEFKVVNFPSKEANLEGIAKHTDYLAPKSGQCASKVVVMRYDDGTRATYGLTQDSIDEMLNSPLFPDSPFSKN